MGQKSNQARRPAEIVAKRVTEARETRKWSQAELARRLTEIGYAKSRSTLTKLEAGQYRNVSVDDLFALAAALGVAPVHLLTPLEDDATVAVAPKVHLPAPLTRAWIRDEARPRMLPGIDYLQSPESELRRAVWQSLVRDIGPVDRALMKDELEAAAVRIADELRNPKGANDG